MKRQKKKDGSVKSLVARYEIMDANDSVEFLDERSFNLLIKYYEKEDQKEKALSVIDNAITQHSYSVDFYIRKAQLLISISRIKEALDALERARVFAPNDLAITLHRADALSKMDECEDALELLDGVKNHVSRTESAVVFIAEANIYEYQEDYDNMYYALQDAILADPANQEALERMWICVELSEKYNESKDLHLELIDENPYCYLSWYNLGQAYFHLDDLYEAMESYEYAFVINEKFEFAIRDYAEVCLLLEKYNRALECYKQVLEHVRPDGDLFTKIGFCYEGLGNFDRAKHYYNKAARLEPENSYIYFRRGEVYRKEDTYVSAIKSFEKAIELNPRKEEYYASLASTYAAIGDSENASIFYKKSVETAPDDTKIWIGYALFYVEIDELENALEVIDEADDCTAGTDLLYCRVAVLFKMGRRQDAVRLLKESFSEDFHMHEMLFSIAPFLKNDPEVLAAISSHQGD